MKNFILALCIALSSLHAAWGSASEELDFSVKVDALEYPPGAFQRKGVKVEEFPSLPHETVGGIPSRELREEIFAQVEGLPETIVAFDELERDRLFLRARSRTPTELQKDYPAIPAEMLKALRAAITD